jgi:hypothetical protein
LTKRDTCSVLHFTTTTTTRGTGVHKVFDGVCTATAAAADDKNITGENFIRWGDECS